MASFLYSNARAVVWEKTLLGKERLKRMTEADFDGAIKILSETGFAAGATESAGFGALIDAETEKLAKFIKEAAPDEKTVKFFLYPFDFKNAEALIKAKFLKTEPVLYNCGSIDVKKLKDDIFSDEYGGLPPFMKAALCQSDKDFTDGVANGFTVNACFTKALYEELFALNLKHAFADKILKAKADLINVGIALRASDYNAAKRQFVHFGVLKAKDLKVLCEGDYALIREKFRLSPYRDEIFAAADGLDGGAGLKEFERLSDGVAVRTIKKFRFESGGAFPFFRYCFYKLADVTNARIVLTGLSGGFSAAEITERLRDCYEG